MSVRYDVLYAEDPDTFDFLLQAATVTFSNFLTACGNGDERTAAEHVSELVYGSIPPGGVIEWALSGMRLSAAEAAEWAPRLTAPPLAPDAVYEDGLRLTYSYRRGRRVPVVVRPENGDLRLIVGPAATEKRSLGEQLRGALRKLS
jgi:hypothetical protein